MPRPAFGLQLSTFLTRYGICGIVQSRSLAGLHLSAFDPKSITISTTCLEEVNRLRVAFRNDLPSYQMPPKVKPNRKHKLTGNNTGNSIKKIKPSGATFNIQSLPQPFHTSHRKCKSSQSPKCDNETTIKKLPRCTNEHSCRSMRMRHTFNPVHEQ